MLSIYDLALPAAKKQRTRAKKDPAAPTRPKSAYMFFLAEFREQWKNEHPDNHKVADIATAAGRVWREMPFQQKTAYEELSSKAKADYVVSRDEFYKTHPKPQRKPLQHAQAPQLRQHPSKDMSGMVLEQAAVQCWKQCSPAQQAVYEAMSAASSPVERIIDAATAALQGPTHAAAAPAALSLLSRRAAAQQTQQPSSRLPSAALPCSTLPSPQELDTGLLHILALPPSKQLLISLQQGLPDQSLSQSAASQPAEAKMTAHAYQRAARCPSVTAPVTGAGVDEPTEQAVSAAAAAAQGTTLACRHRQPSPPTHLQNLAGQPAILQQHRAAEQPADHGKYRHALFCIPSEALPSSQTMQPISAAAAAAAQPFISTQCSVGDVLRQVLPPLSSSLAAPAVSPAVSSDELTRPSDWQLEASATAVASRAASDRPLNSSCPSQSSAPACRTTSGGQLSPRLSASGSGLQKFLPPSLRNMPSLQAYED